MKLALIAAVISDESRPFLGPEPVPLNWAWSGGSVGVWWIITVGRHWDVIDFLLFPAPVRPFPESRDNERLTLSNRMIFVPDLGAVSISVRGCETKNGNWENLLYLITWTWKKNLCHSECLWWKWKLKLSESQYILLQQHVWKKIFISLLYILYIFFWFIQLTGWLSEVETSDIYSIVFLMHIPCCEV